MKAAAPLRPAWTVTPPRMRNGFRRVAEADPARWRNRRGPGKAGRIGVAEGDHGDPTPQSRAATPTCATRTDYDVSVRPTAS